MTFFKLLYRLILMDTNLKDPVCQMFDKNDKNGKYGLHRPNHREKWPDVTDENNGQPTRKMKLRLFRKRFLVQAECCNVKM